MVEKLLETLAEQFPTLVNYIFLIGVGYVVFREYRKSRAELKKTVEDAVNSQLGSVITDVQSKSIAMEAVATRSIENYEALETDYEKFRSELDEKAREIGSLYEASKKQLTNLREAIPVVDEFSPREIYYEAINAGSPQAKAALCQKILTHDDATSKDLEVAGDLMRKSGRIGLALKLYEAASKKDPENRSALAELLAMKIEQDFAERDSAISEAMRLVHEKPEEATIARISNALIDVDRYGDLLSLSDGVVRSDDRVISDEVKVMALRNRGVALQNLGRLEESSESYERAFDLIPDDENTLKPYLSVLNARKEMDQYLNIAKSLVESDPTEPGYYRILVDKLIQMKRWAEAKSYLDKAAHLDLDQVYIMWFDRARRKLEIALMDSENEPS